MKIISGGQTGADQAGLRAAKALGLATGGYVPKGCRTDAGPAPWLVTEYGCVEHHSDQYAPRTIANVRWADGTLWFGDDGSPGGRLTIGALQIDERQFLRIPYAPDIAPHLSTVIPAVRIWLDLTRPFVLNIAGNRERTARGIGAFVEQVLTAGLRDLVDGRILVDVKQ